MVWFTHTDLFDTRVGELEVIDFFLDFVKYLWVVLINLRYRVLELTGTQIALVFVNGSENSKLMYMTFTLCFWRCWKTLLSQSKYEVFWYFSRIERLYFWFFLWCFCSFWAKIGFDYFCWICDFFDFLIWKHFFLNKSLSFYILNLLKSA